MKNRFFLIALALLTVAGPALADIQSPPGHRFNWSRKLSRGVGNMIFSPFEYPARWRYTLQKEGPIAAVSDMIVEGTKRTVVRIGYGLYETATFPFPTWKLTYRPPYYRKEVVDNWWGYTEFAQDWSALTQANYSRTQNW
ncbi:MAG: exosortase system-associated protein, TIGR04073 family [Verrucomicrobiaceae bacterium]|jgi:putative exosortase-associated protein (TIGR04073 family)|nr:exosortase system-associated protein, TIGR04073 family [Verrucomicrobiaceae bacterium]